MSKLTKINVDDLKKGDIVGFCEYPAFGWNNRFRYPVVTRKIVERITPKRTKFILSDEHSKIELDKTQAKMLVFYDDAAKEQSKIAKTFISLKRMQYKIESAEKSGIYVFASKITDEELIKYHDTLKSIYDKYLNTEN